MTAERFHGTSWGWVAAFMYPSHSFCRSSVMGRKKVVCQCDPPQHADKKGAVQHAAPKQLLWLWVLWVQLWVLLPL